MKPVYSVILDSDYLESRLTSVCSVGIVTRPVRKDVLTGECLRVKVGNMKGPVSEMKKTRGSWDKEKSRGEVGKG